MKLKQKIKSCSVQLSAVSLILICPNALSQSDSAHLMQPGLWHFTTRPNIAGFPPLQRSTRLCLSVDDISKGRIMIPSMPACVVIGGTWEEKKLMLELKCRGLPEQSRLTGVLTVREREVTGSINIVLHPDQEGDGKGVLEYRQIGRWLSSECPQNPPAN